MYHVYVYLEQQIKCDTCERENVTWYTVNVTNLAGRADLGECDKGKWGWGGPKIFKFRTLTSRI